MSSTLTLQGSYGLVKVVLPFDFEAQIDGWSKVRAAMLKEVPTEFTRDEWAYLVTFLDVENLKRPFHYSFGNRSDEQRFPSLLVKPRGPIGLWLPNNVSLLGPLMLIIVSLTGNPLRMKAGSRSRDLAVVFLEFSRKHAGTGPLSSYLHDSVHHNAFSSDDPRNREIAESSAVRIVFGSDESVSAIHALSHPADSIGITFTDRRSEAWLELDRCDDEALRDLVKVFAIFGQTGCTSPTRAILLDASHNDAREVRDRVVSLWPSVVRPYPAMNVASDNVCAWQLACAAGWDSRLVAENRAVVSSGNYALPTFPSLMELRIIPATIGEARAHLPMNIQTVGHALCDPWAPQWLDVLAGTRVARFVPLARMHHFETIWDGQDFFHQLFTCTRVQA